jgi:hypothetical protein
MLDRLLSAFALVGVLSLLLVTTVIGWAWLGAETLLDSVGIIDVEED